MYSQVLVIISSLIGVIGTVYAVLSILSLKINDILRIGSWEGVEKHDLEVLTQCEQARIGIPLVILGWFWQTVVSLLKVESSIRFVILAILIIISALVTVVIINNKNREFRKNYEAKRNRSNSSNTNSAK